MVKQGIKMKLFKIGKIIILAIILVVAVNIFKSFDTINVSVERMKEISVIVDETSIGKAQVNWKNVAAIYAVENDFSSINVEQVEQIANLFLEESEGHYQIKTMDDVIASLNYNEQQTEQMMAYRHYFENEDLFSTRMNEDSMNRQFIDSIEGAAVENYKEYGVLPSITIAQAILESDWGRSELSQKYNNLFGIKGHNWDGATAVFSTNEYFDQTIQADFRVYDSISDSIKDHGEFLTENKRYEDHGLFSSKTYIEQALALQEAGYSTIENENGEKIYSESLIQLIQQYQLQLIDSSVYLENA